MAKTTTTRMLSVPTSLLRAARIDADLYLVQGQSGHPVLYCAREMAIGEDEISRLEARGVRELLVSQKDAVAYYENLLANSDGSEASPAVRFRALMETRRQEFEEEYQQGITGQLLDVSRRLLEDLIGVLFDRAVAVTELMALMEHDDTTFAHCVNVASFSLLLARNLGINDDGELRQIGLGSLMHDLGKRQIPKRILQTSRELSPADWRTMRDHPRLGFLDVFPNRGLSLSAAMMVYQHHERADGSGYPVGCLLKEIHPWARICMVADVFHSLTSPRSYRRPLNPMSACFYLASQIDSKLDRETTQCWISMVAFQAKSLET